LDEEKLARLVSEHELLYTKDDFGKISHISEASTITLCVVSIQPI